MAFRMNIYILKPIYAFATKLALYCDNEKTDLN